MNALKCRTLSVYNVRERMLERHVLLKLKVGFVHAIALTGAVCMLILPHAVTAGASLYIEQKYLIAGKLDLISILALSFVFHAITLERSGFKENPTNFLTSVPH